MRRARGRTVVVVVGVAVVGAAVLAFLPGRATPQAFADAVRRADHVALYEGLPHQLFEKSLLEEERRTRAVVEWNDYPLYPEPLALNAGDAERLTALLGDPVAYQPWKGEKLCGGFHPDYAVEWHVGARRYRALVCLGCGEFTLSGGWGLSRYNMHRTTGEALADLLRGYRKNRPRREL